MINSVRCEGDVDATEYARIPGTRAIKRSQRHKIIVVVVNLQVGNSATPGTIKSASRANIDMDAKTVIIIDDELMDEIGRRRTVAKLNAQIVAHIRPIEGNAVVALRRHDDLIALQRDRAKVRLMTGAKHTQNIIQIASCSAGWAMPISRQRPFIRALWGRRSESLRLASGLEGPRQGAQKPFHLRYGGKLLQITKPILRRLPRTRPRPIQPLKPRNCAI